MGRWSLRGRRLRGRILPATVVAAGASMVVPLAQGTAEASTSSSANLYVSATGMDHGDCQNPASPCKTIGYALSQAGPWDHVLVGPGRYPEYKDPKGTSNTIRPRLRGLSLSSWHAMGAYARNTIINAMGKANGVLVEASHASVRGFTVRNARLEGILVQPPMSRWPKTPTARAARIWGVRITDNVVKYNDRGYNATTHTCPSPTDLDDCGEGIHLLGASWSKVTHNRVVHNVGGILVSDGGLPTSATGPPTSVGPAAHNLIGWNVVNYNLYDCGITLPSHDPRAVSPTGKPQPWLAGVYGNVVVYDTTAHNGGAGLLDATPYPGTGAYDNVFAFNRAWGNGNSGFTLHSHAPDQDVNGNVIFANHFAMNNLAGDPDAGVTGTTGILFLSVAVPVRAVVAYNVIHHDMNGIARTANVRLSGGHNRFFGVATPHLVYTAP